MDHQNNWSGDYEEILEQIRVNSVNQATMHKKKYFSTCNSTSGFEFQLSSFHLWARLRLSGSRHISNRSTLVLLPA